MSIGQRLKEARRALKMTQEELASAVGISKGAIGNYETEVSSPNEPILIKLMEVLHVDANYLYQDYMSKQDSISEEEYRLISAYRAADDRAREDALKTLLDHPRKKDEQSAI